MITDDEILSLSDDPAIAFGQYEAICRKAMDADAVPENWNAERRYVQYIRAFISEHDVDFVIGNPPRDNTLFSSYWMELQDSIEYFVTRGRLRAVRSRSFTAIEVVLNADVRVEIQSHITTIRKIVLRSDLNENKIDSILTKLNSLALEVDRSRTRVEALTDVWLDLTRAAGQGIENLAPALDRLGKIADIFGARRDDANNALAAPTERRLLEAPRTQAESADATDEIFE